MPYTENYALDYPAAYEGMVADTSLAQIISRTAEVAVAFGKPVSQGTKDHTCIVSTTGAARVMGIAVRSQATKVDGGTDRYPVNDNVAIMTLGAVWVRVTGTVTRDQAATVNLATGAISSTAAGAGQLVIGGGAVFETSAATGELARIRLN